VAQSYKNEEYNRKSRRGGGEGEGVRHEYKRWTFNNEKSISKTGE